jgi:hypothetical protein
MSDFRAFGQATQEGRDRRGGADVPRPATRYNFAQANNSCQGKNSWIVAILGSKLSDHC